jgi:hypothetical protein
VVSVVSSGKLYQPLAAVDGDWKANQLNIASF